MTCSSSTTSSSVCCTFVVPSGPTFTFVTFSVGSSRRMVRFSMTSSLPCGPPLRRPASAGRLPKADSGPALAAAEGGGEDLRGGKHRRRGHREEECSDGEPDRRDLNCQIPAKQRIRERGERDEPAGPEHPERPRPASHGAARISLPDHPSISREIAAANPFVKQPRTDGREEREGHGSPTEDRRQRPRSHDAGAQRAGDPKNADQDEEEEQRLESTALGGRCPAAAAGDPKPVEPDQKPDADAHKLNDEADHGGTRHVSVGPRWALRAAAGGSS